MLNNSECAALFIVGGITLPICSSEPIQDHLKERQQARQVCAEDLTAEEAMIFDQVFEGYATQVIDSLREEDQRREALLSKNLNDDPYQYLYFKQSRERGQWERRDFFDEANGSIADERVRRAFLCENHRLYANALVDTSELDGYTPQSNH